MLLEIVSPDKKIFKGEVELIQLPGITGSFELLNNHAPLVSVLKKGKIKTENKEKKIEFFEINGGVVEIKNNKIIVLAE